MQQFADAIRVVRELPVPLTEAELSNLGQYLAAQKAAKDTVEARKREQVSKCNAEIKEIVKSIDKVAAAINQKCETREIPCEERRDLETGEIVLFRLDRTPPEEVSRRPFGEDEKEDDTQPSLFGGKNKRKKNPPPPAPMIKCNAINEDGEIFVITAEQADAGDREIADTGHAKLKGTSGKIVKILRGRACDDCGIVNGHRPECDEMKREAAGLVAVFDVDGVELEVPAAVADDLRKANRAGIPCEWEGNGIIYDLAMVKGEVVYGVDEEGEKHALNPKQIAMLRKAIRDVEGCSIPVGEDSVELVKFDGMFEDDDDLDTADIARALDESGPPDDAPLVPPGDGSKPPPRTRQAKPKRGAKKGARRK